MMDQHSAVVETNFTIAQIRRVAALRFLLSRYTRIFLALFLDCVIFGYTIDR